MTDADENTLRQHRHRHLRFEGVAALPRPRRHRPAPLAPTLGAYTQHQPFAHDEPITGFLHWILARAGLDPTIYRARPLHRRLPACLRALHVTTPEDAQLLLGRSPQLLPFALSTLLLGVTEFFRDPPVFSRLATALPAVALNGAGNNPAGGLRIWSVACSDGCELYSIAILLEELGLLRGSTLLGTDCREDAIAAARVGRYATGQLKHVSPDRRDRFFRNDGERTLARPFGSAPDGWIINDKLRASVRFETSDIAAGSHDGTKAREYSRRHEGTEDSSSLRASVPPCLRASEWDVILWRNSAIYLRPPAAAAIWKRLAGALRPGGLLVTGKAERPDRGPAATPRLQRVDTCLYMTTSGFKTDLGATGGLPASAKAQGARADEPPVAPESPVLKRLLRSDLGARTARPAS